jgi:hypothetical protein
VAFFSGKDLSVGLGCMKLVGEAQEDKSGPLIPMGLAENESGVTMCP